jgi:hypothetical protein
MDYLGFRHGRSQRRKARLKIVRHVPEARNAR